LYLNIVMLGTVTPALQMWV